MQISRFGDREGTGWEKGWKLNRTLTFRPGLYCYFKPAQNLLSNDMLNLHVLKNVFLPIFRIKEGKFWLKKRDIIDTKITFMSALYCNFESP